MATVTALQVVTSLVAVVTAMVERRETVQRQINSERKKMASGPRIEGLTKSLTEINEKVSVVEGMMRNLFTG